MKNPKVAARPRNTPSPSTWIKGRIGQYSFVEHHDFVAFDAAPPFWGAGNRGHRVEYAISLDMAMELAMVERNDKGKQACLQ